MKILLTNDDGIYAPGLRALRNELRHLGEVVVAAPASEQSAVGHSITLLHPLLAQEVWEDGEWIGWAVEGKPADCVKLALVELLREDPRLIVSGINAGSNAGINVLYSGTVAAAIEGAFFRITSIAVSLEQPEPAHYERAAKMAVQIIRRILAQQPKPGELFNVNIPELSRQEPFGVRVVEQGLTCYRESYEARVDPRGRRYYWLLPDTLRPGAGSESDLAALAKKFITVTPLHFDLTERARLAQMQHWTWELLDDDQPIHH